MIIKIDRSDVGCFNFACFTQGTFMFVLENAIAHGRFGLGLLINPLY